MSDIPDPDVGRGWDDDPPRRDRAADDWHLHRSPGPRPHRSGGLSEDVHQLSEGDERDLHFNGYPPHNMRPLHELCSPGGCRYKSQAENCADLDAWFRSQDREPDQADPEAEP